MSLLYLGGESAQMYLSLPSAVTGLFQGTLLFFLLGADVFINYRLRRVREAPSAATVDRDIAAPRCCSRRSPPGRRWSSRRWASSSTEKSGVLNLGVEGMMLVGAVVAFIVAHDSGSRGSACSPAWLAGAAMSLVFGVLTLTLQANQVASGLALSLFGVGLSAFIGMPYESASVLAGAAARALPDSRGHAGRRPGALRPQSLVYLSWLLFAGVHWFLYHTARRPRAARGRRVAALGACDRLPGDPHPLSRRRSSAARWRASAARTCRSSTRRCGSRA